ncbi:hypothetical protein JOD24_000731 [Kroppenstedtia sanguinis]|uniref:SPOR domain-containing protein n=1 Tax=Kroppenstedtia sanguinis TaxID=1380684 RepID=UPI003D1B264E
MDASIASTNVKGHGYKPGLSPGVPTRKQFHRSDGIRYLEEKGIPATTLETQLDQEKLYRVQAGAFSQRSNAEDRLKEIQELGITDGFILYE